MGQDLLGRAFWQGLDAKQCLEAPHLHLLSSILRLPMPAAYCSLSLVAGDHGVCSHSPDLCGEAAAQVLEGLAKLRALWQL